MATYRWVTSEGQRLYSVGILPDGTLVNPNKYDPERVRAAVLAADERKYARRSASAKKAAVTRAKSTKLRVAQAARKFVAQEATGPARHCFICGKTVSDPESIARGVGSDCWQNVLQQIEATQVRPAQALP
jgi:hypothetical protein